MSDDSQIALSDYFAKHYGTLRARATRLLGNGDLADDALQDTWLRLNGRPSDGPVRNPGSYLLRAVINIAVDIVRKQGRMLPSSDVEELFDLADPAPGPEQVTSGRSELDELRRQIDRLPPRQRDVILLVHWEGVEQKEVAQRLGISLRTVEGDLKKAHDTLIARKKR